MTGHIERLPVADGIESPWPLKRAGTAGDRRLSPLECPAFLIVQTVQTVLLALQALKNAESRLNVSVSGAQTQYDWKVFHEFAIKCW